MNNQLEISFDGATLRDRGIEMATDHAQSKSEGWKERTWKLFIEFLTDVREPFMMEEFRAHLALIDDYDFPPNNRAFGFIPAKAAREGLIKQIGTRKVTNAKAHCANAAVWEKL